jgi:hypothetical protein
LLVLVSTLRDLQATHDRRDRERMDTEGELKVARARKIEELAPVASFLAGQTILGDRGVRDPRPVRALRRRHPGRMSTRDVTRRTRDGSRSGHDSPGTGMRPGRSAS